MASAAVVPPPPAAEATPFSPPPPPHPSSPFPPDETVYASLIQTYLDLLCHDNATFLAERCAASHPRSERAAYLLARCHYRSGRPKSARSVLLTRWPGGSGIVASGAGAGRRGGSGDDGGDSDGGESERTRSAARYLLAKCCADLGLYAEAEESLLRTCRESFAAACASEGRGGSIGGVKVRGNRNEAMDAWIVRVATRGGGGGTSGGGGECPVPGGAAGLQLLGDLCRKTNRRRRAAECHRLALKLDPLLWTSYEALCELGGASGAPDEADDPREVFGAAAVRARIEAPVAATTATAAKVATTNVPTGPRAPRGQDRYGTPSTPYDALGDMRIGAAAADVFPPSTRGAVASAADLHLPPASESAAGSGAGSTGPTGGGGDGLSRTKLFSTTPAATSAAEVEVPATPPAASSTPLPGGAPPSAAMVRADRVLDRARRVVAGLAYEPSPEMERDPRDCGGRRWRSMTPPLRTMSPPSAPAATEKKRSLFVSGGDKGDDQKKTPKKEGSLRWERRDGSGDPDGDDGHAPMSEAEPEGVGKVLELLCTLGAAYRCLCQYRSQDALGLFRELPSEQINTGWVQHMIGKAYFEMSDYCSARRALQTMQKVEPHRIRGLDILSTTLWQLKKEVELSDLAQQAVDQDRMAPEAWFVVGNCFSLQKEHETAICFFRRAIQLDPSYTYAHTLCGHEYTSNEDYEKAISCFRDAVRVDTRHYNAWYGLGAIYFRQEKFDLAEYHFRRALDINSQSPVLRCHLGMAQHQNGRTQEALDTLAGAFRLDPRNPQARYQRATIFMSLDRPEDALAELEKVRAAAPREASVHFNLGKVHKRLGQPARAMRCFLTALDLDPKDNNLIKAAMDRLDEPDVEEEVSVF
ncbi:hypothetical protein ACHAWF_009983 [Thalassiosira exigua]